MAGLRDLSGLENPDPIEAVGIERARRELAAADIVLWLGAEGEGPAGAWEVSSKADLSDFAPKGGESVVVSAATGEGVAVLKRLLIDAARRALPKPGEAVLNARQHLRLEEAAAALSSAQEGHDPLIIAEELRRARLA